MRKIISIQGPMVGGKTTLAKRLENILKSFRVIYENPYPIVQSRNDLKLYLHTLEGFIKNQHLLLM
ncbi:hypothetical protein ACFWM3_21945 [Gottfriedia sp. NPDC058432]|uniref:hypothetical protein n=1 Tax=Gottfriedia sp. NPDC058432 TaxID=3346497 RepID=UPI003666CD84